MYNYKYMYIYDNYIRMHQLTIYSMISIMDMMIGKRECSM